VRRVLVRGVSGSGKSTLGRAIAERLDVPYVELDALNHQAGWSEATPEELRAQVEPWVAREGWVIDGGYGSKLGDLTYRRADTLVWLDLPIRVWLPRLARRTARRMLTGEELWNGNRERVRNLFERPNIFQWAWQSHFKNRAELEASLAGHPGVRLVRLRTPAAVRSFLDAIEP
jgi:adenylate kinase family enzyme